MEHGGGILGFGSSSQAAGRGPQAVLVHWLGGGDLAQKFAAGRLGPQIRDTLNDWNRQTDNFSPCSNCLAYSSSQEAMPASHEKQLILKVSTPVTGDKKFCN